MSEENKPNIEELTAYAEKMLARGDRYVTVDKHLKNKGLTDEEIKQIFRKINNLDEKEAEQKAAAEQAVIKEKILKEKEEERKEARRLINENSNLTAAILGGAVASFVSAVLWFLVTYFSGYEFMYASVVIGFITGYTVLLTGRGAHIKFGIIGGLFALLGTLLGIHLTAIGLLANAAGIGFFEQLSEVSSRGHGALFDLYWSNWHFIVVTVSGAVGFTQSYANKLLKFNFN